MPFTVSHPAIVLPLKRWFPGWFSLTGLMSGAMAPDLVYFLTMTTQPRGISHSWLGLFVFCLPAGMLFAVCFHLLFKRPAIYNLPQPFDIKLSGLAETKYRLGRGGWLKLAVSVLLGALSHFFWDSFTHRTGEIVQLFPILNRSYTVLGITRPLCRFIQHISTIAGGLTILITVYKGLLIPSPAVDHSLHTPGQKLRFWLLGGSVATLFAVIVVMIYYYLPDPALFTRFNSNVARTVFGLAGWAGFYYFVCIYSYLKPDARKPQT